MKPLQRLFKLAVLAQPSGDVERGMEEEFPVVNAVRPVDIEADIFFVVRCRVAKSAGCCTNPVREIWTVGVLKRGAVVGGGLRVALQSDRAALLIQVLNILA